MIKAKIDAKTQAMIKASKDHVTAMLNERLQLSIRDDIINPSEYWMSFCEKFDYMLNLEEEAFLKLRLHTYHLTGDNYQRYFFMESPDGFIQHWLKLISHRPEACIISEPREAGGFGIMHNGRLVSEDIIRFQTAINSLYDSNIIQQLAKNDEQKVFLEIGAGYGGFAHHISRLIKNTTYVIVDLPEVLLFSIVYISLLNPQKKLYIYNPKDVEILKTPDMIRNYDFVFVPNYRLDWLEQLQFDLVINIASLQEMRTEQVDRYLRYIAEHCKGWFFSWNQDAQPKNKELTSLTEMLKTKFMIHNVTPSVTSDQTQQSFYTQFKTIARKWAVGLRLVAPRDCPPQQKSTAPPYIQYVCRSLYHIK